MKMGTRRPVSFSTFYPISYTFFLFFSAAAVFIPAQVVLLIFANLSGISRADTY
jgi:hypothetical protein